MKPSRTGLATILGFAALLLTVGAPSLQGRTAGPFHETTVVAPASISPGGTASLRIIVHAVEGIAASEPIRGASVKISLHAKGLDKPLWSGITNHSGTAAISFRVPDLPDGRYELRIHTESFCGKEDLARTIQLERRLSVLLLTDKPIYQPGQTIQMRALALDAMTLAPIEAAELILEAEDPKGNKVFKKFSQTSAFGVADADFILADEVNLGQYRIRALIEGETSEKTVTVKRYVLPKFGIAIETDRSYFLPGDRVSGSMEAAYFFGKPVADAAVTIAASTFDVAFEEILRVDARTDGRGRYAFDFELPDYFIGQPLQKGEALIKLDFTVIDSAGHTETKTRTFPISAGDLCAELIPEGGRLVPGVKNTLYAAVTTPDGRPSVDTDVVLMIADMSWKAKTGSLGIANFRVKPRASWLGTGVVGGSGPGHHVVAKLEISDKAGHTLQTEKTLSADALQDTLLLHPDRAVYSGGDSMALEILSTFHEGTIYIDLIKGGQTVLTRSTTLTAGSASLNLDLSADLVGTLEIHAYKLLASGDFVRDTRLVYVNAPDALDIDVKLSNETYRPGEEATIRFHVTDHAGKGVASALGVIIVDESVYALQEIQPGLEKVYFTLERELAKPRFEIHYPPAGLTLTDLVREKKIDDERQDAAAILLSAAAPAAGRHWEHNPGHDRLRQEAGKFSGIYEALYQYGMNDPGKGWHYSRMARRWVYDEDLITRLVEGKLLGKEQGRDPWGRTYRIDDLAAVDERFDLIPFTRRLASEKVYRVYQGMYQLGRSERNWVEKLFDGGGETAWKIDCGDEAILPRLVEAGYLKKKDAVDPWGYAFSVRKLKDPTGEPVPYQELRYYEVRSPGPDGHLDTDDDETSPALYYEAFKGRRRGEMMALEDGAGLFNAVRPAAMMVGEKKMDAERDLQAAAPRSEEKTGAGPIRLRQHFPETLLFLPELVTDVKGEASYALPLADSITTWRLTASANSAHGLLGSTSHPIRVFQDFFIDLDLPVFLTQNDEVSIPVAIYNYLAHPQKISLELERADSMTVIGKTTHEASLDAGEVGVHHFRIRAEKPGALPITVTARGDAMSDAIKRTVRVAPDGKEFNASFSGSLTEKLVETITIPVGAVDGASKIFVKIYPGVLSQVVDGLDGLLRMPFGCFEQTSSVTYPNVLALDYMRSTDQITPEIEMRAEALVNTGYQRLLTFEVPGGGFEWFGKAPAHKILTAYGLMEFHDMAKVAEVDGDLIARTARWLTDQQEADGSWKPTKRVVDTVARAFTDDVMRNTGYIAWALLESENAGEATEKAVRYIRDHIKEVDDAYTLALCANALVAHDASHADTQGLLEMIYAGRREDAAGKIVFWKPEKATAVGSRGDSAEIETTALILYAFIKAGVHPETVNMGLNYLVTRKDPNGAWHSTQATILALRTLIAAAGAKAPSVDTAIEVRINGSLAETVRITPKTSDVLRLVDLVDRTREGENVVELVTKEPGHLMAQVVGRHYLPWDMLEKAPEREPIIDIDLSYDRRALKADDILNATVTVRYNGVEPTDMVIVDLGIPPGFSVITEAFEALIKAGTIEKFTLTGRQATLYIRSLVAGQEVRFDYAMKAKYPIRAKTPATVVYQYYNPEVRAESAPVELVVEE